MCVYVCVCVMCEDVRRAVRDLGHEEVSYVHSVVDDGRVEWSVAIITFLKVDVLWEIGHHTLHTPAVKHQQNTQHF